jgi:hypothetical protein
VLQNVKSQDFLFTQTKVESVSYVEGLGELNVTKKLENVLNVTKG